LYTEPDGFSISILEAETFNKNMNFFNLLGKKILLPIIFDKSVEEISKIITPETHQTYMGPNYTSHHDM